MILFICAGNVCRSPMAEYLLRKRLGPETEWKVASAGISAIDGMSASPAAVTVLRELGINARGHESQSVTRELVDAASVIVVMTRAQLLHMQTLFPDTMEKLFLHRSFERESAGDVDDPMGSSEEMYREIRDELDRAMPGLVAFLQRLDQ